MPEVTQIDSIIIAIQIILTAVVVIQTRSVIPFALLVFLPGLDGWLQYTYGDKASAETLMTIGYVVDFALIGLFVYAIAKDKFKIPIVDNAGGPAK